MPTMFINMSRYKWADWIMGVWRAVISGGSNGVLSGLIASGYDPEKFNLQSGLNKELEMMATMFVAAGLVHMFIFLSTHAGPDPNGGNGNDPSHSSNRN